MTRSRKHKRGKGWQPEEVLAGKVELGARELAELIQRVNPTDRALPAAEAARRYRLKNQLQSLLVRRFTGEVEVSADRDGMALLAHRGSGKSACHAVLAELDEDARSWVQRRLDEAAAPEPAEAPASPPARASAKTIDAVDGNRAGPMDEGEPLLDGALSVEELLARGHEAMAAYDYELARRAWERALAGSGGGSAAAGALLGLLVEHLAAYSEAAALWPRLSPAAAADGRIRTLAALAAAHVGEEARAHELLRGLTREEALSAAAEVYQVLARRSLARDDEAGDSAAAHELALARQHSGPSLPLLELERELAAQVARRCAPLEARAVEAYDAGRVDEAEQRAREVLARWPESRAARTLLGRIEAQRRQARVDALLARADAAMTSRDFPVAVGLLREARSLDVASESTRAGIAARLEQAEAAARDQLAQSQVFEVAALFAGERLEEGLLAYLGLDQAQRAEVRRTHGAALLGWLEEMGAPPAGARAHAAVQAVLALARACAALARGDGHAAEAEIAAHEKMLRQVSTWRAVQKDAADAVARSERERAQDALARAAALLDAGGDPAQVRALVDAIDPRRLTGPAMDELEPLRARLTRAESRAAIEARIERALARGDLLDARDAADAGLAQALPGERAGWQARSGDLDARLRRAWCVQVCPGDDRTIMDRLGAEPYELSRGAPLTPDGAHFVLAVSLRRWLFLRVIATRDLRVTQYVLMRTPAPLQLDTVVVLAGEITLVGKRGKILRLKPDTWDVIAWRDLGAFVGEHETVFGVQAIAGTALAWLWTSGVKTTANLLVIDLARWSLRRSLSGSFFLPVRVGTHARALMLLDTSGIRRGIYQADGTMLAQYQLPETSVRLEMVTFHPYAPGLIVVDRAYDDDEAVLRVRWVTAQGEELAAVKIESNLSVDATSLGTDPDGDLIFLSHGRGIEARTLLALAIDDGLRVHYRVPLSESVAFLQDAEGAHRFAMDCAAAELELVPIGREPPRLPAIDTPRWTIPSRSHVFECNAVTPADDTHLIAFRARLEEMDEGALRTALRSMRTSPGMDARMWADVLASLSKEYPNEVADEFVAWARRRYPDHADLALNAAEYLANKPSWSELPALLDAIDASKLPPRRIRHLHHLRGLALFHAGRHDEALAAWREGAAHAHGEQGACELQPYIEMLAPVDPDRGEGAITTDAGRVRWSITQAARCLARDDVRGALAAMDRAHVWQAPDMQALAHLADVYRQSEDRSPVHVFHQLLALAAFDAHSKPDPESFIANRLVFPAATFSKDELITLAARVRAWLDEYARRCATP
ncbi:MAG TPA: hypothetical protein VNM90_24220 [Haliangium sp.]|nr:hypothetical protein [Haliangium sp.]